MLQMGLNGTYYSQNSIRIILPYGSHLGGGPGIDSSAVLRRSASPRGSFGLNASAAAQIWCY